ncbi:MAG: hypothetical protein JSV61_02565 [Anaerolineales bacterium]|nr:MAG: hypothetical protein JSV61_02565 [Anaerolineales bacterium]
MNNKTQFTVDPEGKWMFRVAGICAIVLVVGYFLTFPIYFWVGDQPTAGVEAQLAYFADHAAGWWAIVFLMVVTDLLLVPIFFGIYMALKHINKGLMLVALAFKAFLFVILDLAVTWTAYSTMIISGVQYGAATTEAQKAALAAAAAYASAMLDSPLLGTYAILIPSLGVLFAGLVMLKGVFNKATAYLALAASLTGILFMGSYFIDSLAVFRYINALLATFFYLLVGVRLYKLGRL